MSRYCKSIVWCLKISKLVVIIVFVSHLCHLRVSTFSYERDKYALHYPMVNTNLYVPAYNRVPAATRIEYLDKLSADIGGYE